MRSFAIPSLLAAAVAMAQGSVSAAPSDLTVDVSDTPINGFAVPEDFVSISLETKCLGALWDKSLGSPRLSYARLMGLLQSQSGGRGPNIRVGGDSTDYSAYIPASQPKLPPGISYRITADDFSAMRAVEAFNGTFTLGLNFLSPYWFNGTTYPDGSGPNGTALGIQTLQAMVASGIPLTSPLLESIEVANEPDIAWMTYMRPLNYTAQQYTDEYGVYLQALISAFPEYPFTTRPLIQGGTLCCQGSPTFNSTWLPSYLQRFGPQGLNVFKSFSYHDYPYNRLVDPWVSVYSLLSPDALTQNYENWTIAAIDECQAHGRIPFTVGEGNSIGSGGKANVSDVYGSALWILDQFFYVASLQARRWNVHGCDTHGLYSPVIYKEAPGSPDVPQVMPVFYGMWAFAQASRKGAVITHRSLGGDAASNPLISVWAVTDSEGMQRVVVLNKDANVTVATNVTVTLANGAGLSSTAYLYRLRTTSPLGVLSHDQISLAGQTFDANTDGSPVGTRTPELVKLDAGSQGYSFAVGPAEAIILEVPRTSL